MHHLNGVLVLVMVACSLAHQGEEHAQHYTNEWVVRLEGGPQVAELVAMQLGYTYKEPVVGFMNTYRMVKDDHPQVNKRGQPHLTQRFTDDTRVLWADQQFSKQRDKRGVIPASNHVDAPDVIASAGDTTREKRSVVHASDGVKFPDVVALEGVATREKRSDLAVPYRGDRFLFNDELWDQQWYMHDTRTRYDLPKLDLHVLPVYARGISGRGVRVSVLDDGIEYTHEDLRNNYDPEISYDVNDGDDDPMPRYDEGRTNQHGTRCAGEVAMVANNGKCGVGVAFNARIGGVRLLDGMVNDRVEGIALGFANDKVDIYSASWGPTDNGQTLEGPGRLASEALEQGIKQGRGGKGVIFVWASGNGGGKGDDCNCDGYITSIYTLAIGSASQQGHFPWYGEQCASTLAAAYSSGAYTDQMIVTTDLNNKCTTRHTGTSAAAPLAAGIIALALEVNPELTWRDVQHLVVWTSEWTPLQDNLGWQKNAAGYWVNTRFGFGLMNADALVLAAANWTNVPTKAICTVVAKQLTNQVLKQGTPLVMKFHSSSCQGTDDEVRYLEHVQVVANIQYPVRGVLEVALTSPQGTKLPLLRNRKQDNSSEGFVNWQFMSVLTWGERSEGVWTVEILDKQGTPGHVGSVGHFTLILHGTKEKPAYLDHGPRQYDEDYNRIHRKTADQANDLSFPKPMIVDPMELFQEASSKLSEVYDFPIYLENEIGRQSKQTGFHESLFGDRTRRTYARF